MIHCDECNGVFRNDSIQDLDLESAICVQDKEVLMSFLSYGMSSAEL